MSRILEKIQTEFMRPCNRHSAVQVAKDPLAVGRARRIIRGENLQTAAKQVGAARIEGGTSVGKEPCDYRWRSHSSRDRWITLLTSGHCTWAAKTNAPFSLRAHIWQLTAPMTVCCHFNHRLCIICAAVWWLQDQNLSAWQCQTFCAIQIGCVCY